MQTQMLPRVKPDYSQLYEDILRAQDITKITLINELHDELLLFKLLMSESEPLIVESIINRLQDESLLQFIKFANLAPHLVVNRQLDKLQQYRQQLIFLQQWA